MAEKISQRSPMIELAETAGIPDSGLMLGKMMSEQDQNALAKWIKGTDHANYLITELANNGNNMEAGTPKVSVMVEACANFVTKEKFGGEHESDLLPANVRKDLAWDVLVKVAKKRLETHTEVSNDVDLLGDMAKAILGEEYRNGKFDMNQSTQTVLADVVEEVVSEWVINKSPQAKIQQLENKLQQEGKDTKEEPALTEEQVKGIYENDLKEPERKKIDALAEALIGAEFNGKPAEVEAIVRLLSATPKVKRDADLLGDAKAACEGLNITEETTNPKVFKLYTEVIEMRMLKDRHDKVEVVTEADMNQSLFRKLPGLVSWRMVQLENRAEERKSFEENIKEINNLELISSLEVQGENDPVEVKSELNDLEVRQKARELKVDLKQVSWSTDLNMGKVKALRAEMTKNWRTRSIKAELDLEGSKYDSTKELLEAVNGMKKSEDTAVRLDEVDGSLRLFDSDVGPIGTISIDGKSGIKLKLGDEVSLEQALESTGYLLLDANIMMDSPLEDQKLVLDLSQAVEPVETAKSESTKTKEPVVKTEPPDGVLDPAENDFEEVFAWLDDAEVIEEEPEEKGSDSLDSIAPDEAAEPEETPVSEEKPSGIDIDKIGVSDESLTTRVRGKVKRETGQVSEQPKPSSRRAL